MYDIVHLMYVWYMEVRTLIQFTEIHRVKFLRQ